jgi:hypothetical protein
MLSAPGLIELFESHPAAEVMMLKGIRYGRVLLAAVISEAGVIAVLWAAIGVYWLVSPGMTDAEFAGLGEQVGYYVAPTAGVLTTLAAVLWAARTLTNSFVAHGVLIGLVSVLLTVPFFLGARPEHRLMYVIAFVLRIAAGYAGGVAARSRFETRATSRAVDQRV